MNFCKAMTTEIIANAKHDMEGEIFCFHMLCPNYKLRGSSEDPLYACKALTNPDTMHMQEAMKQPDLAEFLKAMDKEWKDQCKNGNFSMILRCTLPKGAKALLAAWQMKRKWDI